MSQTVYSLAVILLGIANVVLAAIAYSQRARQLASRAVSEHQLSLATRRNQMAAERIERLDQQVALLRAIRDSVARDERRPHEIAGVIDVGSTTVRLVVATRVPGGLKKVAEQRAFLHLGAEVERDGRYTEDTMEEVAARVAALEHQAACAGASRLAVVVTAPGRLGENPQQLTDAIAAAVGCPVTALTAADEARLAFAGAAQAASPHQRLAVCDIGGGSTELAFGTAAGGVQQTRCFDTGALSITQRHLPCAEPDREQLAAARHDAQQRLQMDELPDCDLLLATGGSARAVAKLVGSVVDAKGLEQALDLAARPPKRARKRLSPERRRSLPAGVLLLSLVQARLSLPVTVSRAGMREGVLLELLEQPAQAAALPPAATAGG